MKYPCLAVLVMVGGLALVSGCQEGEHQAVKPVSGNLTGSKLAAGGAITYGGTIRPIFERRCATCHNNASTIPNWLKYETAFQKRAAILQRVVVDKTMPMAPFDASMTPEERKTIGAWVNAGAPLGLDGGSEPAPTPNPGPAPGPLPGSRPGPIAGVCNEKLGPELLIAVATGNSVTVDKLLVLGACPNTKDEKGRPALIIAIVDQSKTGPDVSYARVAASLITAGADVNAVSNGGTPLIWAEYNDAPDIAESLIDAGADVNAKAEKGTDDSMANSVGFTPLMLAVQNTNAAATNALLRAGANAAAKTDNGVTAAALAAQIGDAKRPILVSLINTYLNEGALNSPSYARDIQPILQSRCAMCHNPATPALNWLNFETANKKKALIYVRAVLLKDMPMSDNVTKITDEERALLGRWIQTGGAK